MPVVATRIPLDRAKYKVKVGTVFVIRDRCKECKFCIELCPKDVLRMSQKFNKKGYRTPEVIPGKENACVACRFCEQVCPDFAIVLDVKERAI